MNTTNIIARDLPDAWFQCIYNLIDHGRRFHIDKGSYEGQERIEFDYVTIQIKQPWTVPMLPKLTERYNIPDPVKDDYIDEYLPYLMTAEKKEGEEYTYGERLCAANVYMKSRRSDKNNILYLTKEYINQIEKIIETYKTFGHRNNQMVLQIAQPSDLLLSDPPCLRHIDTRIQDNTLHFFPYFRSWDLWGGFPANLQGIEFLKQHMASEIGVENGQIIASSKGLHIYGYAVELAETISNKK